MSRPGPTHDGPPPLDAFSIAECVLTSGEVSVAAAGDLDVSAAAQLQVALGRLARGRRRTALDLSHATFIESAVLAVIIRAARGATRDSWSFRLMPPPAPVVLRLFELTGVSHLLEPPGPSPSVDRRRRSDAADRRDVAAEERHRDAMRRASREQALEALRGRDRDGSAARIRRDALSDRQAAAAERRKSGQDRH